MAQEAPDTIGALKELVHMNETTSETNLQKTCVIWSSRRERNISLRIYYDRCELDGCKIYALSRVDEL